MSDGFLSHLSRISSCLPGPEGSGQLVNWVRHFNDKANAHFGHSDDSFSAKDFAYARTQPWGKSLELFSSYSAFQTRIAKYIENNIDSDACRCDGRWVSGGEQRGVCVRDPEAPKRPTPPRRPKPPPKKPPKPELPKREGLDIAKWDLHQDPWWGELPKGTSPPQLPAAETLGKLAGKDWVPLGPNPFAAYKAMGEEPDRVATNGPYFSAKYDGKDFILDFYGCKVDHQNFQCQAPWSYYFLLLKNVTSHRKATKQAGLDGWARIRIGAKPGDMLFFSGQDSLTRQPSLNKLAFTIDPEGKAVLVGNYIRNKAHQTTDIEKTGRRMVRVPMIGQLLGGLMLMFSQFDRASRRPSY